MTQMQVDEFNDRVILQLLWLLAALVAAMRHMAMRRPPAVERALRGSPGAPHVTKRP
jgi:hypothetical protein